VKLNRSETQHRTIQRPIAYILSINNYKGCFFGAGNINGFNWTFAQIIKRGKTKWEKHKG